MATSYYLWDFENDSCIAETDHNGAATAVYTVNPKEFGQVVSQNSAGVAKYLFYDALGSVRVTADSIASITGTAIYDAWGSTRAQSPDLTVPYQWNGETGYYTDTDVGLLYVRNRIYDPALGRWLSVDPIGEGTGDYAYVGNRYVNGQDPSGLEEMNCEPDEKIDEATKKGIKKTLPCRQPTNEGCNCEGDKCTFSFSLEVIVNMNIDDGFRLCFAQTPGERPEPPDPPPTLGENRPVTRKCESEINRTLRPGDHFTIDVRGTKCKFTEDMFPRNKSWPPDWKKLPQICQLSMLKPVPPNCWEMSRIVRSVEVDFTIEVYCGCDLYRTRCELPFKAKW